MSLRVVESLIGVGDVFAGGLHVRSTSYQLSVLRDDEPRADDGELRVEGHIDITGIGEAVVLAGPQDLTLRLEDGRRLRFALTDSGGHIVGRAGLEPAE
jgi:hypothetical protein